VSRKSIEFQLTFNPGKNAWRQNMYNKIYNSVELEIVRRQELNASVFPILYDKNDKNIINILKNCVGSNHAGNSSKYLKDGCHTNFPYLQRKYEKIGTLK
jgi:hypothetical protein